MSIFMMNKEVGLLDVQAKARRYQVSPQFILREIAGEGILVPVGDSGIFAHCMITLSDSCRFIWNQFEHPHTVEEVIALAEEAYTDPTGMMAAEIEQVVAEYFKVGLLKEV